MASCSTRRWSHQNRLSKSRHLILDQLFVVFHESPRPRTTLRDELRGALVYNDATMSTLETTISAPLVQWEDGSIRITASRVPLDTVIYHFKIGATAEEIVYKFPSLRLADIYGAIYYYLAHRDDVEEYLPKGSRS